VRRALRVVTVAVAATLASAASLSVADAGVYTSNGVRCTIVGTPGPDHLTGTAGRDVICGLGGNDVISGGGGNDLIDGGSGNDKLYGGPGNDKVLGDGGSDVESGGDGADVVSGGTGADVISGGTGNDVLRGNDGNDTLTGGTGTDTLAGGAGNDDEDGSGGADKIYGGDGTNWCTIDPNDTTRAQCVYDAAPPAAQSVAASPDTVDVTSSRVDVTLTIHATDDTGIRGMQVSSDGTFGPGELVAGTVRDGWWKSYGYIPRWSEPSTAAVQIDLGDRAGRHFGKQFPDVFTIKDSDPDTSPPVVTALTVSPDNVDVRTASQTVTVMAHVTDDASGMRGGGTACLMHPLNGGWTNNACPSLSLASGTPTNGWWTSKIVVPQGSVGADWDVALVITDNAHPNADNWWLGPDLCRSWLPCDGGYPNENIHSLPNGAGQVHVTGTADNDAPDLVSLTISPDQIDTLPGDVTVGFDVHATDEDSTGAPDSDGITDVTVYLHAAGSTTDGSPTFATQDSTDPISGTRNDGVWHISITVPQGTPPGSYAVQVMVEDAGHWRSWVSPASPYAGTDGQMTMTAAQAGPDNGTVTVVQHQA